MRLWVDRAFHVRGAGTVVTGTLPAGTLRVGDVLALGDEPVRVRGLECLGRPVDAGRGPGAGGGPARRPRARRAWGAAARWSHRRRSRRSRRSTYGSAHDGPPPERPLLHLGSTRQSVHARPLGDDPRPATTGDAAAAASRRPAGAARPGQPRALGCRGPRRRSPAPAAPWCCSGTGRGARPPRLRTGRRARGARRRPAEPAAAPRRTRCPAPGRRARGGRLAGVRAAGGGLARTARRGGRPPPRTGSLPPRPPVTSGSPTPICSPSSSPSPYGAGRAASSSTPTCRRPSTRPWPCCGPISTVPRSGLRTPSGSPSSVSTALPWRGWHAPASCSWWATASCCCPAATTPPRARLAALPQPFTLSEARQALDTSRRVALPLLAHLDRTGRTVRLPDDTRRVR